MNYISAKEAAEFLGIARQTTRQTSFFKIRFDSLRKNTTPASVGVLFFLLYLRKAIQSKYIVK